MHTVGVLVKSLNTCIMFTQTLLKTLNLFTDCLTHKILLSCFSTYFDLVVLINMKYLFTSKFPSVLTIFVYFPYNQILLYS